MIRTVLQLDLALRVLILAGMLVLGLKGLTAGDGTVPGWLSAKFLLFAADHRRRHRPALDQRPVASRHRAPRGGRHRRGRRDAPRPPPQGHRRGAHHVVADRRRGVHRHDQAVTAYSRGRVLLIMSALLLSTLMASLDSSFLPLAFPDMIDDLDSSTSEIVWVALGYLVAATGPMLLAARMADAWGHVRLFQAGTVIYSLAMIACTFAPDVPVLIGLRLVQGLGMALFLPTTFAIATRIYGPEQRGRALGLLQAANAAGFILGPIFAGWLLDAYDWRATFASRIPFAILTILLALLALDYRQPMAVPGASRRFDVPGARLPDAGPVRRALRLQPAARRGQPPGSAGLG